MWDNRDEVDAEIYYSDALDNEALKRKFEEFNIYMQRMIQFRGHLHPNYYMKYFTTHYDSFY